MRKFVRVLMPRYLIYDIQSSITVSWLMRVFACLLYFCSWKKDEIHKFVFACSTHYKFNNDEKSLKGTANSCCDTISGVGILNPEISCAFLSHHLVKSCRLVHNFSAAWSMGSKEIGLIPVLFYHVPGITQYKIKFVHV